MRKSLFGTILSVVLIGVSLPAHLAAQGPQGDTWETLIDGPILSFIARAVTPQLSFWFDPAAPSRWLAHRMPLYSDGPEVVVVRQGVSAKLFIE